jgi:hypothetical protein
MAIRVPKKSSDTAGMDRVSSAGDHVRGRRGCDSDNSVCDRAQSCRGQVASQTCGECNESSVSKGSTETRHSDAVMQGNSGTQHTNCALEVGKKRDDSASDRRKWWGL